MNRLHRWYCRSHHWQQTLGGLATPALAGVALGDAILEVGAGPGLLTPQLSRPDISVTAIDVDHAALQTLRRRSPIAAAVCGDASQLPFAAASFSSAVAFTMLHHLTSSAAQDAALREIARVLRPGAPFVGADVRDGLSLRLVHVGDTFVPLPVDTLQMRLQAAGFTDIGLTITPHHVTFRARRLTTT